MVFIETFMTFLTFLTFRMFMTFKTFAIVKALKIFNILKTFYPCRPQYHQGFRDIQDLPGPHVKISKILKSTVLATFYTVVKRWNYLAAKMEMIFCKSQYPSLNVHFLRGQSRNSLRQIVADLRFCSAGTRGVVALSLFSTYQHASIYHQLIPAERSKLKAKLKPKPWQSALTLLCV